MPTRTRKRLFPPRLLLISIRDYNRHRCLYLRCPPDPAGGSKSAEIDDGSRLSLDEIKRYIIEQIYESVGNQIPGAWEQFFLRRRDLGSRAGSGSQSASSGTSPLVEHACLHKRKLSLLTRTSRSMKKTTIASQRVQSFLA